MDLEFQKVFEGLSSKGHIDSIKSIIMQKPELIDETFELALTGPERPAWHAAWILDGITDEKPQLASPYISRIVRSLDGLKTDGQKRHLIKLVIKLPLPEDEVLLGMLCKTGFDWLENTCLPVSIRVHAMQLLFELSKKYPEIKQELHDLIIMQIDEASAGFKSRAMKILPHL